jgi:hypothetical protein
VLVLAHWWAIPAHAVAILDPSEGGRHPSIEGFRG